MAEKNFTQFDTAAPLTSADYIVGYKADGSAELKATVNQVVDLVTANQTLQISSVQIRTRPTANVFIGNSTTGRNATTGNHNFVFGLSAGNALTTGYSNNFLGSGAGRVNTTGYSNNFLGRNAGYSNTTGVGNNFLGGSAGFCNTTGGFNNFFGYSAGLFNTTGGSNNFFGDNAGRYNSTGINNNFIGRYAGLCNTTGSSNNFLGRNAGFCNTTGSYNNFLGPYAGCSNTTGRHNNFFGTRAGCSVTTGSNNTIIGNAANVATGSLSGVIVIGAGAVATQTNQIVLSTADISLRTLKGSAAGPNVFIGNSTTGRDAATGNHNFVFGLSAGNALTDGYSNIFIGNCAGRANSCGYNNIFLGKCAGFSNTTGGHNNFLGSGAGRSNIGGTQNNFIGFQAGYYNTTGQFNNFFGTFAGTSNTTGINNNFIGRSAGQSNKTGNNNNFFGWLAGFSNTYGNSNNFLGFSAGCTNTVGSNNTIIGNQANVATNSLSGVIVLGTGAVATESHQIVLSANSNTLFTRGNTFNIGTPQTSNNLTVNGEISANNTIYDATGNSTQWNQAYNVATTYQSNSAITTGRTIYVDSVRGTDTRTGLSKYDIGRPFATIAAAVAASTLGDLVWVRNGSYTIAAQINLGSTLFDLKGNIYFEPNTQVTCPSGVTAFSFTSNNALASVSIDGGAIFLIVGTGGIVAKGGASTMNCTFKAVIDAAGTSTKTLFSCTGGTLFIFADAITAPSATVFLVNDTQSMASRISAIVPYVLGGNCIDVSGASTTAVLAHFTGDFWSLGGTMQPVKISGSAVPSIAANSAIYRQVSPLGPLQNQPVIRLISSASAFGHGIIVRGGPTIWDNYGNPAVGMEGAPASTYTNVAFKDVMFTTVSAAPCLSANQARDVQMTSCYANTSAHANVTIEVGSLAVNARYNF